MVDLHAQSQRWGRGPRFGVAFVVVGVAVAATAMLFESAGAARAVVIGVLAAAVWAVAEAYAPSGSRRGRRTISASAAAAVAIALCVGWNTVHVGLGPVHALGALAAAAVVVAIAWALMPAAPRARILLVGSGYAADAFELATVRDEGSVIVGRIDDSGEDDLLGDLGQFESVVADYGVTSVVFAYAHASDARLALIAARCSELELDVGIVPRLFEVFDQRLRVQRSAGVPLLVVDPLPHQARMPVISRIADVAVASVLLVVTLPVWLALALAITIEEPGPILYRARRIGMDGQEFDMFKFRKMRRDALGPRLTRPNDDRFTRVGRMLAVTKLDELPQLINVMRGEMGLVGPRPEDPSFVAEFREEFREILTVRPGITGLSQIQYRNESQLLVGDDFDELYRNELLPRKLDLDRYYARRRSVALDARILTWTAIALVAGARVRRNELTASVSFERHDAQELQVT